MFEDTRLRTANALMLQWHAGVAIEFEAFQTWGLATLRSYLQFDGAVWGLLADVEARAAPRIQVAHWHRLPEAARTDFETIRHVDLAAKRPADQVTNICVSDPLWQDAHYVPLRKHALTYGLPNSLSVRFADPNARGHQFLLLTRKDVAHQFAVHEAREFGFLAPHLMQAYATRRRLYLDIPQAFNYSDEGVAVALVTRTGVLQDQQPRFLPMMRREWSDWSGKRLPEPILDLAHRHSGTRWRFLGSQIVAEFVPAADLDLVVARPRRGVDVLTQREGEVARLYAMGANFREVAESLNLAPTTVRAHLRSVFGKLSVRNKAQLAASMR